MFPENSMPFYPFKDSEFSCLARATQWKTGLPTQALVLTAIPKLILSMLEETGCIASQNNSNSYQNEIWDLEIILQQSGNKENRQMNKRIKKDTV